MQTEQRDGAHFGKNFFRAFEKIEFRAFDINLQAIYFFLLFGGEFVQTDGVHLDFARASGSLHETVGVGNQIARVVEKECAFFPRNRFASDLDVVATTVDFHYFLQNASGRRCRFKTVDASLFADKLRHYDAEKSHMCAQIQNGRARFDVFAQKLERLRLVIFDIPAAPAGGKFDFCAADFTADAASERCDIGDFISCFF